MSATIKQLEKAIQRNLDKLPTYTTATMSKIGVRWCKQVTRAQIKRLRAQLKELKGGQSKS